MKNQAIQEALEWRYAAKRFDPSRKVSEQDWKTLAESLKLAPSSYGLQPWRFLVVENPEVRAKLKEASYTNHSQVLDSSQLVVFLYKEKLDVDHIEKYIRHIAKVRAVDVESLTPFRNGMVDTLVNGPRSATIDIWAQRQAYIAMGFLMETAALLKIDTCAMEGIDNAAYNKILNLEGTGYKAVAAVAVGYRHPEDKYQTLKKVRFEDAALFEYIK